MIRAKIAAILAAAALVPLAGLTPAGAASQAIVAQPGSFATGYTTPVMAVDRNQPLDLITADLQLHDVVSVEYGPDDQPWCSELEFPAGRCPLIWSNLIPVGITPVLGLENTVPGTIYNFYCSIHRATMKGRLLILPE